MAAPENQIFVQGQGSVDADALNTFIQWASNVAGLRAYTGVPQMVAQISGYTVPNDGGQGFFYWDPNATAADDNGVTTVQPNGVLGPGRWIREPFGGNATAGNLVVTDNTDTVTEVTTIIFDGATVSPASGTGTATVTIGAAARAVAFGINGQYVTPSFPTTVVENNPLPTSGQTIQVDTASACGIHDIATYGNATCFQAPVSGTYLLSLSITTVSGNLPDAGSVIGMSGGLSTANGSGGSPIDIPDAIFQVQGFATSAQEFGGIVYQAGSITVTVGLVASNLVFANWSNEPPVEGDNYTYLYFSQFCGHLIR